MAFDLLAFAGGFAESSMERMDKTEKEAKEFALASTKNMYKKYSDRIEEDKLLAKETADDLATIQGNFVDGNAFTKEQLAQIAASPANRKAIVEAIKTGTMNFANIKPAQMVKLAESNAPTVAIDKIIQAGQLDKTLNDKLTEQKTFGQMYKGFYSDIGSKAGKDIEEKTARAFGTTVEEMQAKLAEKRPEATATFDLSGLRKETTFTERIQNAASAVGKAAASGDNAALDTAKAAYKKLADEKENLETMLNGPDVAKQLANKTAKTTLVLSDPSKYSKEEVEEATRFNKFELNREKLRQQALRPPKEPKEADTHVQSLITFAVKSAKDDATYKRGDTQMVMNPVEGGKPVRAESPEGISIIKNSQASRVREALIFSGSLNTDGSVKTDKTAQWLTVSGVDTYVDNGKLFVGSKPSTVAKPAVAPAEAIAELNKNPTDQNKKFFKDTFGYLPEEGVAKPAPVAAPTTPSAGFATKPSYVPPPESPAGKAQAMRTKLEEEKVKSSQLKEQAKKQAGEKLSLDFSRDAATLSPIELSRKYDPIRSQLSTADKVKLQSEERKI